MRLRMRAVRQPRLDVEARLQSAPGLQTPREEHHDQHDENDSTDTDSATWPEGVVAAATTKQQDQDQNQ